MRRTRSPHKPYPPSSTTHLASLLLSLTLKRQSYSLQLIKQFYLFPQSQSSSQRTVSKYDSLIFSDQILHTMWKKIETKVIENKIWGFINLKYVRYLQAVKKMEEPVKMAQERVQNEQKVYSFVRIRSYAEQKGRKTRVEARSGVKGVKQPVYNTPKKIVPMQSLFSQPKTISSPSQNIQINIEVTHNSHCHTCHPSNLTSTPSTKPHILTIQQPQPLQYPITQIHPSRPVVSRSRSRSGSVTRYVVVDGSGIRKRTVNGVYMPYQGQQLQQSSRVYMEYGSSAGRGNRQLQNRENLQYSNVDKQQQNRSRITPSKGYTININHSQNSSQCQRCGIKHAYGVQCTTQRPQSRTKIIRLRSKSKLTEENSQIQTPSVVSPSVISPRKGIVSPRQQQISPRQQQVSPRQTVVSPRQSQLSPRTPQTTRNGYLQHLYT